MIPDAAVEAAAKWLHDIDCRSAVHGGHPADFECYDWLDEAREMLGLVGPHIRAQALRDAALAFSACEPEGSYSSTPTQVIEWLNDYAGAQHPEQAEAAAHGDD